MTSIDEAPAGTHQSRKSCQRCLRLFWLWCRAVWEVLAAPEWVVVGAGRAVGWLGLCLGSQARCRR